MQLTEEFDLSIEEAQKRLKDVVTETPTEYNAILSKNFKSNIYLKREDLQIVRSYKLRGAYNMISTLDPLLLKNGAVCASAGNHAQGFAYSCNHLKIKGVVFMPKASPKQKIKQTKMFGNGYVEIILEGDTFDDCAYAAKEYAQNHDMTFIPPFDHPRIIEGQGTIAVEILKQMAGKKIDYLFIPVGGGGLCSGAGAYIKQHSPDTKIIAVEPQGAPCMTAAFEAGHPVTLGQIDRFVDGAAVKKMGDITYQICKQVVDEICLVPEGEVCTTILKLYNENAMVVEPAGAMSITALNHYMPEIEGKNVVCIVSGSNNDIDRMQEIKERSLVFQGLKHYFIVRFPQRARVLQDFMTEVINEHNDIVRFDYMRKNQHQEEPTLLAIELDNVTEYDKLINRMIDYGLDFKVIDGSTRS